MKSTSKKTSKKTAKKTTAVKKIIKNKKDITEIVVDFESACKVLKRKPLLPDVSMLPEKQQKSVIAYIVLITIIEAMNEGWVADFTDSNQYKYYAYFYVKKEGAGFGFSLTGCFYTTTYARTASRLCLNTSTKALLMAERFKQYYIDYLL